MLNTDILTSGFQEVENGFPDFHLYTSGRWQGQRSRSNVPWCTCLSSQFFPLPRSGRLWYLASTAKSPMKNKISTLLKNCRAPISLGVQIGHAFNSVVVLTGWAVDHAFNYYWADTRSQLTYSMLKVHYRPCKWPSLLVCSTVGRGRRWCFAQQELILYMYFFLECFLASLFIPQPYQCSCIIDCRMDIRPGLWDWEHPIF